MKKDAIYGFWHSFFRIENSNDSELIENHNWILISHIFHYPNPENPP